MKDFIPVIRLTVDPMIPDDWDHFAVTNLPPYGQSVVFDRTGAIYGLGAGLHILPRAD